MATATTQDVATLLLRSLEPEEETLAEALLGNAELLIRTRVKNFDTIDSDLLVMVEAAAVARVLRNPDGIKTENADGFGQTFDPRVASGYLQILDAEWKMLGVRRGYASVPMKFRR